MSWFADTINSSLGRKLLMSVTGLGLTLFLFSHLVGNLFLLLDDGGATFNEYAHNFKGNPLIIIAEVVIFSGFIIHIIDGILLTRKNKAARKTNYAYKKSDNPGVSWNSKQMSLMGILFLLFFILHISHFFLKSKIIDYDDSISMTVVNGVEMDNLYAYVLQSFSVWWYTLIYLIAMVILALHLNHGFQSAFQSLGVRHVKYTPIIKKVGTFISIVVPAVFAAIPLVLFIKSL